MNEKWKNNEKNRVFTKENLDCLSQNLTNVVSNFKIQQIIFEPSYPFLDNLLTLSRVTCLIKSILIEEWLL